MDIAYNARVRLLGGFSASLVYRVLAHLLTAVETVLRGDPQELQQTQDQLDRARAIQTENNRLQLLGKLSALRQNLQSNMDPQAFLMELERLQQQIALNTPLGNPAPDVLAIVQQKGSPPETVPPEDLSTSDAGKTITITPASHDTTAVVRR